MGKTKKNVFFIDIIFNNNSIDNKSQQIAATLGHLGLNISVIMVCHLI